MLVDTWDNLKAPGDFLYHTSQSSGDQVTGLNFMCPCGCGEYGSIQFDTPFADSKHPKWTWNGNREHPTLKPSIQRLSGCRWHGYLTDGIFHAV